jgi:hypothetical protein
MDYNNYQSRVANPDTRRKDYIQDKYNQLDEEDYRTGRGYFNRDNFYDATSNLSREEASMVRDADVKLSRRMNKPLYRQDYVGFGKAHLPKNQVSIVVDQHGREIKTSRREPSIDRLPRDKKDMLDAYRFGSDSNRFTDAVCPHPEKYTPIMYDKRDTKTWPWEVNAKFEDPVVDRSNNIQCCDVTSGNYVPFNDKFLRDSLQCGDLYDRYKEQEKEFTEYINRFLPPLSVPPYVVHLYDQQQTNLNDCSSRMFRVDYIGNAWERNIKLTLFNVFIGNGHYDCLLYDHHKENFIPLASFTKHNNMEQEVVFRIPSILPEGKFTLYVFKQSDRDVRMEKRNTFRDKYGKRRDRYYYDNDTCIKTTVEAKGRTIFEVIDTCRDGIVRNDIHIQTLLLETYAMFFSQPTRKEHFRDCVCRGDYGHQIINKKIDAIERQVKQMLTEYNLSEEEQGECISILSELSEKIDIYSNSANWLDTTSKKLRAWIAFNYRASERIKRDTPDKKLSETTFYNIIKHVIKCLLKQIAKANIGNIELLHLLPKSENESIPMEDAFSPFFLTALSYLIKEIETRDALLSMKDRISLGMECRLEQIATISMKISFLFGREVNEVILTNLARNNRECAKRLYAYIQTDAFKQEVVTYKFNALTEEKQLEYRGFTRDEKTAWKNKLYNKVIKPISDILTNSS